MSCDACKGRRYRCWRDCGSLTPGRNGVSPTGLALPIFQRMSQATIPSSANAMLASRRDQMFPTLAESDIEKLRRFAEPGSYATGEHIVRAGEVAPGLIVVLSGHLEIVQDGGFGRREVIVTHGPPVRRRRRSL